MFLNNPEPETELLVGKAEEEVENLGYTHWKPWCIE
jgi:hypothetical protein